MTDEPKHQTLTGIAEAMADGMPVDWQGLKDQEPGIGDQIAFLRAVGEVIDAYHALRARAASEEEATEETAEPPEITE
jgi:hypothetical protein